MKLRSALVLASLALAVLAHPAAARADDERAKVENLDPLLADISRARKEVKTLRAAFTQERRIKLLATSVKSRGELTFASAPDRLRWDLAPPDDIVYFIGPEGLSYKTKSSAATIPAAGANIARALADVRALLAGDLAALRERYVLSATRSPADVEITGATKDPKASVRSFTLVLGGAQYLPIRARLVERASEKSASTDSIDLVFSNVVANAPVDAARLKP